MAEFRFPATLPRLPLCARRGTRLRHVHPKLVQRGPQRGHLPARGRACLSLSLSLSLPLSLSLSLSPSLSLSLSCLSLPRQGQGGGRGPGWRRRFLRRDGPRFCRRDGKCRFSRRDGREGGAAGACGGALGVVRGSDVRAAGAIEISTIRDRMFGCAIIGRGQGVVCGSDVRMCERWSAARRRRRPHAPRRGPPGRLLPPPTQLSLPPCVFVAVCV